MKRKLTSIAIVMIMVLSTFLVPAYAAGQVFNFSAALSDKSKWIIYDGEVDVTAGSPSSRMKLDWTTEGIHINTTHNDVRLVYNNPNFKPGDGDTIKLRFQVTKNPAWVCVIFRTQKNDIGVWDGIEDKYAVMLRPDWGIFLYKWGKGATDGIVMRPDDVVYDNPYEDKAPHTMEITATNVNNNTAVHIVVLVDSVKVLETTDSDNPILAPGYVDVHALHDPGSLSPLDFTLLPLPNETTSNTSSISTSSTTTSSAGSSSVGNSVISEVAVSSSDSGSSDAATSINSDVSSNSTISETASLITDISSNVSSNSTISETSSVDEDENNNSLWTILIIAAIVILGGGVAAYFFIKKRKVTDSKIS